MFCWRAWGTDVGRCGGSLGNTSTSSTTTPACVLILNSQDQHAVFDLELQNKPKVLHPPHRPLNSMMTILGSLVSCSELHKLQNRQPSMWEIVSLASCCCDGSIFQSDVHTYATMQAQILVSQPVMLTRTAMSYSHPSQQVPPYVLTLCHHTDSANRTYKVLTTCEQQAKTMLPKTKGLPAS